MDDGRRPRQRDRGLMARTPRRRPLRPARHRRIRLGSSQALGAGAVWGGTHRGEDAAGAGVTAFSAGSVVPAARAGEPLIVALDDVHLVWVVFDAAVAHAAARRRQRGADRRVEPAL